MLFCCVSNYVLAGDVFTSSVSSRGGVGTLCVIPGYKWPMVTFRYRTAAIRVSAAGPVAVAMAGGIVTPASLAEIIRDSAGWAAGNEPLAKVVDYSSAVLATHCEQMLASAATVGASAVAVPAAPGAGAAGPAGRSEA